MRYAIVVLLARSLSACQTHDAVRVSCPVTRAHQYACADGDGVGTRLTAGNVRSPPRWGSLRRRVTWRRLMCTRPIRVMS